VTRTNARPLTLTPLMLFALSISFLYGFFFFFNDTATTEIYTLSLHDALPICWNRSWNWILGGPQLWWSTRSEEHTSELQSLTNLVCRLLLEKKKKEQDEV